MVLALGYSLTTGRVDHPLDFLQWTLDEAQGPPVLTATAFPPTLHCVEGRSGRAQQRLRYMRQRVRCRSRVEVRGGQEEGMKVEVGNGGAVRGGRAPSRPAFPVTRPPRSGFTDLFLPHRPCPVPLHGERYSFLPWPAFIRSQSPWVCGNYPGPGHCCSPDLDEQSHEGLIKQRSGTQVYLISPCE